MEIFVKIDGGIGRVLAATGAVEEFARKKKEEGVKVSVVSTYPQLFNGLDHINRIYNIQMPYLYEDYISKGEFIEPEPYNHYLYYKEDEHLATVFNFLLNGKREFIAPKMILTDNEKAEAKASIIELRKSVKKKIMVIQPWGSQGGIPLNDGSIMADESYRSFGVEFFKKFIDAFKDEFHILSVQAQVLVNNQPINQCVMANTQVAANPDVRKVIAILPYVDIVVACDSFIHHASAALGTPVPTMVLWAGTSAANLGYKEHINMKTKKDVLIEPNRVPHDHSLYLNKNKGCNEFDIEEVKLFMPQIKENENGTTGCGGRSCSANA